jgi:LCP family protein required for cell wall assembly
MTQDRTEQLIRDAFAEEAAHAADPREVLAAVRSRRPRRSYGLVLATAAVVVVVAAVATFVVPKVFRESTPVAQYQQNTPITPQNVLVIGTDGHGYTDSIILTQLAADGSTSLVSLPRDTWVPSAETKLNQIYVRSGIGALVTTVSELTGVKVDHWVEVDTTAIGLLTNAVGGVQVCLRAAASDRYAGADFPAGKQVITGDAAIAFIRQRHGLPNGDLDRIVRLQVFLHALLTKLDAGHVPTLLDAVKDHVKMDPALDAIAFIQGVANDKAHFGTIPFKNADLDTPQGMAIEIDPGQVKQFVANQPSTPPATGDVPCVN